VKHSFLFYALSAFAFALRLTSPASADVILFDSYTPPGTLGGGSSANSGIATEISVTSNLAITSLAVNNGMGSAGNLRFAILSVPLHQFLYLSPPKAFAADAAGELTWKQSDPLSFTFLAGNQYAVGYLRDVDANDFLDSVAESSNGVTSTLKCDCLDGFANPSFSHQCFTGVDQAIRLIGVPEPATTTLLLLGMLGCGWRRR